MKSDGRVLVGSRRSKLAMIQSRWVVARLQSLHPELEFEPVEVVTTGDRHRHVPLDVLGGQGVFVKELEEALLERRIDVAVHSAKDMPTETPSGLRLAATPRRVDPRDVLVSRSGKIQNLAPGARIGTGSQRRAVQIAAQRPDLQVCGCRGNVDTRLRKVSSGEFEGVLLAAAALIRLGMEQRVTQYFEADVLVPAVGQGALAIETRADDERTGNIVAPLNDERTWQAVAAERAFLRALGGGCRAPIAALGTVEEGWLHLRGLVADPEGKTILRHEADGGALDPEAVGSLLAGEMMANGASSLLRKDSR
jgi:hydroxymethylbilane synthase